EHIFRIWHTTGGRTVLPVTFRGIPYGATAFQTALARVRIVPADRNVVLADATLADRRANADAGSFDRLLAAARARGEMAIFYSGPLSGFAEVRAKLGADWPDVPVLAGWGMKHPAPLTLAEVRRLGRNVVVITPETGLSAEAAQYGFEAHWIAPADAGPAATGVRRHDTLAQCADFLAAAGRKPTP
ncbi:MAG TPA: hypothetical protein PK082_09655, partial [Phycisphaerae bacterium]|nr:hypothetical protein [Phycisphaerae bacterium]